jgi:hypothetical protein
MLRRWRETEWGAIWGRRRQSNEPKQGKWIGGSFEVGDILGVNILEEPAESIRERMSNRSTRSSSRKPGAASSAQHLPLSVDENGRTHSMFYTPGEGGTSFFAPDAGPSILRPSLSAEEEGRKAHSDFGARPTLEIITPAVKSDSHIPVIMKERERAVHYAQTPVREEASPAPPSEVLERSHSELLDTSAEAMSTPDPPRRPGEIVIRGRQHIELNASGGSPSNRQDARSRWVHEERVRWARFR